MSSRTRARSLDDLTEDILIHILSFLPTVDAIRTSILSRQWLRRNLWRVLPSLDFSENRVDDCILLAEFIDHTIKKRSAFPIQKSRLICDSCFCDCDAIVPKLDNWISYAISHKVKELKIEIICCNRKCVFNFGLLNNSCVRDVRLFYIELGGDLPSLNLGSIRTLCLTDVNFPDETLADLISCCNNLESLNLESDWGCNNRLRICSTTLKNLLLRGFGEWWEDSSLEICCPNLCSLFIWRCVMDEYCIKGSASLEADVCFNISHNYSDELIHRLRRLSELYRELSGVKRLTAENYWFQLLCEKDFYFLEGCVFENLNHLELKTGCGDFDLFGIAALLKICPNITTLTLYFSWYSWSYDHNGRVTKGEVGKPIEFNIPNLKILCLKNSKGKEIKGLVELMKKHGTALEKIVVWDQNGKRSSIPL